MTANSPSLRSIEQLRSYLTQRGWSFADCHLEALDTFEPTFPIRIPIYYANLIDWQNPDDPLKKLVIPDIREQAAKAYEVGDPIGDHHHEVVPGLVHRYPDRCLLLLTSYCLVHCRFCFRREVVGKVRPVQFQAMLQYLEKHPEVKELIFSGGDPFSFPVGFLSSMRQHFAPLKQLKIWRFHTRIPAIDPMAISAEWLAELAAVPVDQKIIVIHIDHAHEITPEFKTIVKKLQQIGCMVLSQTVLLKGVNADQQSLIELFHGLVEAGVKPYYLHHLDKVFGSHHFRISIEEGKRLYQSLRGNLTGVGLPEYVLDSPAGEGKIPVMWMRRLPSSKQPTYEFETFTGKKTTYIDYAD